MIIWSLVILILTSFGTLVSPLAAQDSRVADLDSAFLDATARSLIEAARTRRVNIDRSLVSYTALITERFAAGIRAFRRDRNLFHYEAAKRAWWHRDDDAVVMQLAARMEHPGGVEIEQSEDDTGLYEPDQDPIFFGFMDEDDEDFFLEHPLWDGAEEHYQYQTGDTLRLSLPDGRTLLAIEVEILPRLRDIRLVAGSLWIEPESGGLVRAAYRLSRKIDIQRDLTILAQEEDEEELEAARDGMGYVPGIFRPLEMELKMVVVEYGLWNFKYWLPRAIRADGEARAGVFRIPGSFEITYQIEDAWGEDELEERRAAGDPMESDEVLDAWDATGDFRFHRQKRGSRRPVLTLIPWEEEELAESPHLPPPIWDDFGPGISEEDVEDMFGEITDLPEAPLGVAPVRFTWGYQGSDLLRYNRIEGLSVGARVEKEFRYFSGDLTARIGTADRTPDLSLGVVRDRPHRRLALRGYYGLRSVDERQTALGAGSSATALLFGRDDGEYYRAAGASVDWLPGSTDRRWYRVGIYGEYQEAVERNTDKAFPSLWDGVDFRPNIGADEATQFGALVRVSPWWGPDRTRVQGGLDGLFQGEAGDFRFFRASLTASLLLPITETTQAAIEVAGGNGWGDLPVQRQWFLGGASTLRGYSGSTLTGTAYTRGRVELSRGLQAMGFTVFGDWGWAGSEWDELRFDRGRYSAGMGVSIMDGLIRLDVSRALKTPTGWRLDLYLGSLL